MSLKYSWRKTTHKVYRAIYDAHMGELKVFESYTQMARRPGIEGEVLRRQITAWGFAGAEHPLIYSELTNFDEWEYFILYKVEEEE